MAKEDQQKITNVIRGDTNVIRGDPRRQLSDKTVVYASVAALMLGGPLLGLMGLSFFGTLALLIVASPLLLLSGPLMIGLFLVLAGSVAAFSVASLLALGGIVALGWAFKQVRPDKDVGLPTRVVDKLVEDENIKG